MKFVFVVLVFVCRILSVVPAMMDGYALSCWECNSHDDPKCSEDNFSREESSTIKKVSCSKKQKELKVPEPAQTCLKSVLKREKGSPVISRRCAFIGNPNLPNVYEAKCFVKEDGGNVALDCLCGGSYCNGSTTINLWSTTLLAIPIILLCCKSFLDSYFILINPN